MDGLLLWGCEARLPGGLTHLENEGNLGLI